MGALAPVLGARTAFGARRHGRPARDVIGARVRACTAATLGTSVHTLAASPPPRPLARTSTGTPRIVFDRRAPRACRQAAHASPPAASAEEAERTSPRVAPARTASRPAPRITATAPVLHLQR